MIRRRGFQRRVALARLMQAFGIMRPKVIDPSPMTSCSSGEVSKCRTSRWKVIMAESSSIINFKKLTSEPLQSQTEIRCDIFARRQAAPPFCYRGPPCPRALHCPHADLGLDSSYFAVFGHRHGFDIDDDGTGSQGSRRVPRRRPAKISGPRVSRGPRGDDRGADRKWVSAWLGAGLA